MTRGVPQGTVLGPLLFSLFINDLPLSISNPLVSCDLFADDTSIQSSDEKMSHVQSSLQQGLNDSANWCYLNQIVIYPGKTKCITLASRQKHQTEPLTLNLVFDNPIEQVHSHKVLGVLIDDKLRWETHFIISTQTFKA